MEMKNVQLDKKTIDEDSVFINFEMKNIFLTVQLERQKDGIWKMGKLYHDCTKMKKIGIKHHKKTCPYCTKRIAGYACDFMSVGNTELVRKQRIALIFHPNVRLGLLVKGIVLDEIIDSINNKRLLEGEGK